MTSSWTALTGSDKSIWSFDLRWARSTSSLSLSVRITRGLLTAVLEVHQRRGIGTQLVREMAKMMLELGRPALSIHPISGGGWIVRMGFREVLPGLYQAQAEDLVR